MNTDKLKEFANDHTPEPWILRDGNNFEHEFVITTESRGKQNLVPICSGDWDFFGPVGAEQKANARRIVACVNRLAPFTTEQIEDPGYDIAGTAEWFAREQAITQQFHDAYGELQDQRDELLAALNAVISVWDDVYPYIESKRHTQEELEDKEFTVIMRARQAIAKAVQS